MVPLGKLLHTHHFRSPKLYICLAPMREILSALVFVVVSCRSPCRIILGVASFFSTLLRKLSLAVVTVSSVSFCSLFLCADLVWVDLSTVCDYVLCVDERKVFMFIDLEFTDDEFAIVFRYLLACPSICVLVCASTLLQSILMNIVRILPCWPKLCAL